MSENIDDPDAVTSGFRADNAGVVEPPTEDNSRRASAGKVVSLRVYRPHVVPEIEALKLASGDHYLPCLFQCDEAPSRTDTPFYIARRPTGTVYYCQHCGCNGIYSRPYTRRVSAA